MATLIGGPLGTMSGKVGNMVFVTRNGKCFVRSLPKRTTKPVTEKQIIQRAKFGMAMRFISPLSAMINESYKLISRKKTGSNVAVKEILRKAIKGSYPDLMLDFPGIRLIKGSLAPLYGTMLQTRGSGQLSFSWPAEPHGNASSGDEILILIYSNALPGFWYKPDLRIRRWDGSCSITLPEALAGKKLQVWLVCRSADHRAYSNSEYMGEALIKRSRS